MRVKARRNVWYAGAQRAVGVVFDMSDDLAQQLIFDGLVERIDRPAKVEASVDIAEAETVEKPKVRRRKKS